MQGKRFQIAVEDKGDDRAGELAVARRIGEVGKRCLQHRRRTEGTGQPHAPAARQAECGEHRLENSLVAERDR